MKGEHYSGRTRSTGTVVFYSIYFVLLAAALSAAVVGLGKLWEFLQHYEACQIYHTIDAVAEELNSGNLVCFTAVSRAISPPTRARERRGGSFPSGSPGSSR